MDNKLPYLAIGDLKIEPPIIQGGMGVRVSKASMASAVSNTGALGVIASVGIGKEEEVGKIGYNKTCALELQKEIKKAKRMTKNPIGVNIMVALSNYDSLVQASVEAGVDVIISGAGLPLKLPELVQYSNTKLIPIVSSARAADLICRCWAKKYNRLPDAFIVEGPLAGGHLGFSLEELKSKRINVLDSILKDVLEIIDIYQGKYKKTISMIAAGGIFDGKDIAKALKHGADGVQIATRFVCTHECDVAHDYKKAYIEAKKEDILIIDSPVGLPLRVIRNKFVERILNGEKIEFVCNYKCLKTCNEKEAKFCVAKALLNSSKGNFDEGFATCGWNAFRIDKIISVKELIGQLEEEAIKEFNKDQKQKA
jgi:nitronate monooxygenase